MTSGPSIERVEGQLRHQLPVMLGTQSEVYRGALAESVPERHKLSRKAVIRQGFAGASLPAVKKGGNGRRLEGYPT